MKVKQTIVLGLIVTSCLVSCDKHPSFSNSTEAVNGCHEVLTELQGNGSKPKIPLTAFSARILLLRLEVL